MQPPKALPLAPWTGNTGCDYRTMLSREARIISLLGPERASDARADHYTSNPGLTEFVTMCKLSIGLDQLEIDHGQSGTDRGRVSGLPAHDS